MYSSEDADITSITFIEGDQSVLDGQAKVLQLPLIDRQDLFDLQKDWWHKTPQQRKHIGLSTHNKRILRERFHAELRPEAELRRNLYRLWQDFNNICAYIFSGQCCHSWLMYALS